MFNKQNKINFSSIDKNIPNNLFPKPASLCLPDWYKKQESYSFGDKRVVSGTIAKTTIKRCMPIFDSITFGYIIFSTTDIYVSQKDGYPYFNWPSNIAGNNPAISFHSNDQFSQHPQFKNLPSLPKFFNPWVIETPSGYSCFITSPMHRDLPFEILSGVIDTDSYNATIHLPFYLKNQKWEGLIPSGTPIAQVIPFKREDWKINITSNQTNIDKSNNIGYLLSLYFFNRYKKLFWKNKNFN